MKVRIRNPVKGTRKGDPQHYIETTLDVLKIEELKNYQIILHCYNGSIIKIDLEDIIYMNQLTIIKREK